jgi:hypothetical protein
MDLLSLRSKTSGLAPKVGELLTTTDMAMGDSTGEGIVGGSSYTSGDSTLLKIGNMRMTRLGENTADHNTSAMPFTA